MPSRKAVRALSTGRSPLCSQPPGGLAPRLIVQRQKVKGNRTALAGRPKKQPSAGWLDQHQPSRRLAPWRMASELRFHGLQPHWRRPAFPPPGLPIERDSSRQKHPPGNRPGIPLPFRIRFRRRKPQAPLLLEGGSLPTEGVRPPPKNLLTAGRGLQAPPIQRGCALNRYGE